MTPEQIEQVVNMLAQKLGPIGGQVWSIYVRQVYISVAQAMFFAILLVAGAVVCGLSARKLIRAAREANSYDASDQYFGVAICLGAMGAALILAGLVGADLFKLLNPEYYAIQMLLGR